MFQSKICCCFNMGLVFGILFCIFCDWIIVKCNKFLSHFIIVNNGWTTNSATLAGISRPQLSDKITDTCSANISSILRCDQISLKLTIASRYVNAFFSGSQRCHKLCSNDYHKFMLKHIWECTLSMAICMPNARFQSHWTGKSQMKEREGLILGLEPVNFPPMIK